MVNEPTIKKVIKGTVSDLVVSFLAYDRREDEDLPYGAIEEAVKNGVITADEIASHFAEELKNNLYPEGG